MDLKQKKHKTKKLIESNQDVNDLTHFSPGDPRYSFVIGDCEEYNTDILPFRVSINNKVSVNKNNYSFGI